MEQKARELIEQYVTGWKENNGEKIICSLTDDCVIIESHGPTYRGVEQVKKWVELWKKEYGTVIKWDITSFYFIETSTTAFFEWEFVCNVNNKQYELPGISIVKCTDNKISFLHEYRMTKKTFDWNLNKLQSE